MLYLLKMRALDYPHKRRFLIVLYKLFMTINQDSWNVYNKNNLYFTELNFSYNYNNTTVTIVFVVVCCIIKFYIFKTPCKNINHIYLVEIQFLILKKSKEIGDD